jgi:hypothetical protein
LFPRGIKRQESKADHSHSSSTELKNDRDVFPLPCARSWRGAKLLKPLVKFTLLTYFCIVSTAIEVGSSGNNFDLYSEVPGSKFQTVILTQIFLYLPQSPIQIPGMMPQLGYHR